MPRFTKQIVAVLMLAGGVLLAGTSFVDAHSPGGNPNSCFNWGHEHYPSASEGVCEYSCILKGHNHSQWTTPMQGTCECSDQGDRCED